MRVRLISLSVLGLSLAPLSCSSGKAPTAAPTDGATLTYSPKSCGYSVEVTANAGYTQLASDSATASTGDTTSSAPTRVRLGLGGGTQAGAEGYADPTTSVVFTWETSAYNQAAKVQFGTSAGSLGITATGYVWTVPAGDLIASDSYFHEVHVCGLQPGTTYYYKVGGGPSGADAWSAVQAFTTLPAPSATPITVGVLGDARDNSTTWQAAQGRLKSLGVAMQLISGDIVDLGISVMDFNQWLNKISATATPPAAAEYSTLGTQLMVPVSGNHENDSSLFFANWALPGSGDYAETYGSFNVGAAHIIVVDDNQIAQSNVTASGVTVSDEVKAQLAWLEADLTAANSDRGARPFILTMSHRGLFSSSQHGTDSDVLTARALLAPLYAKYRVDLVLNGHEHLYERSIPLAPAAPSTNAPPVAGPTTYVICAGAGAEPYPAKTANSPFIASLTTFGGSATTDAGAGFIGVYGTLAISPTSLVFTAYGLTGAGPDPVIDTFTLTPQQ